MKTLVRNKLGNRTYGFALPCTGEAANTFCQNFLDGEYSIYESKSKVGNPAEAKVSKVTVTGKNSASKDKVTFSFYAKPTLNEDEIRTALLNITANGVKLDEIYVINMEVVQVTAPVVGP